MSSRFYNSTAVALVWAFSAAAANAAPFNVPSGSLEAALDAYSQQSGIQLVIPNDQLKGIRTTGVRGELPVSDALSRILSGTGFVAQRDSSGIVGIVRDQRSEISVAPIVLAQAAPMPRAVVETVTVTSSKLGGGDVQSIPISITALSQKQLTAAQVSGGPDLIKQVPNLTFSKTNFTGYNIEIRGIGTQAISVTTDPAVAVAFNDTPFLRNHFFEQEFYDLASVEVLRGPQGTLYGRNATAGVVNVKSAPPTDQYEAMLSGDFGNYGNRRLEAMLNVPIVGDTLDIRLAGEWTKRDGYTTNTITNSSIDGRDLWSTRASLIWRPTANIDSTVIWEHFSEDDNRLRSAKQLCQTDPGPGSINGHQKLLGYSDLLSNPNPEGQSVFGNAGNFFTQGCKDVSLYSPNAFEAPVGYALPYVLGLTQLGLALPVNPYADVTQSTNLRSIASAINPTYRAKNDTLEWNSNWNINPELTLSAETGYNNDFLFSAEDYNRFGATPGLFAINPGEGVVPDPAGVQICQSFGGTACGGVNIGLPCPTGATNGGGCALAGYFCDPQLGCSDRLIVEDLSTEKSWQLSQEVRLSSNFSGPLNFTAGGNFLHYETLEKYYVLSNALTLINGGFTPGANNSNEQNPLPNGFRYNVPKQQLDPGNGYIDPNPITSLNDQGHNYFLSKNPYVLNSYAGFGEVNYKLTEELKITGGLRYTIDQKHFTDIPSEVATQGYGLYSTGTVNQEWDRFTGRAVVNWTPTLDFSDQTLVYGSYAHGYKAGGANPPGAIFTAQNNSGVVVNVVHPLTFKPEYIEAFELGTKNTFLDGALTLNGDVFYYNYHGYQISEIVDRTAINTNYNAHVEGAELETSWEPLPGLKFGFNGGFEDTALAGGQSGVDLLDRTAGHSDWYLVKPFSTEATNCIFPAYVAQYILLGSPVVGAQSAGYCDIAYQQHLDPFTQLPYVPNPTVDISGFPPHNQFQNLVGYPGFDPSTAPNNGAGYSKNLSGHPLPNAPKFTVSLTGEYTMPISSGWAATLHGDFYWQSNSWARVFDDAIDRIHGYPTVNGSLILTSSGGWQVMGYVKNIFDVTAITGTFLNSDDTGLTTNIFTTDPRLFGVRITKHLDDGDGVWGADYSGADFFNNVFADADKRKPTLWLEVGGQFSALEGDQQPFAPPFVSLISAPLESPVPSQHAARGSFDYSAKVTYEPEGSDWVLMAAIRYGRSTRNTHFHQQTDAGTFLLPPPYNYGTNALPKQHPFDRYTDEFNDVRESHEIIDFAVGKDVGLGMFGMQGSSDVSVGVRYAHLTMNSNIGLHSDPDYTFHLLGPKYEHNFTANGSFKRSFLGLGPSLSWDANTPVSTIGDSGSLTFDWGATGAVLFGHQRVKGHKSTAGTFHCTPVFHGGCATYYTHYQHSASVDRAKSVAVPNLGALAGISIRYPNAKLSFGYRADFFFGAMDGGIDAMKKVNRGFYGPYLNVSLGL